MVIFDFRGDIAGQKGESYRVGPKNFGVGAEGDQTPWMVRPTEALQELLGKSTRGKEKQEGPGCRGELLTG